jgi:hypothetical protein
MALITNLHRNPALSVDASNWFGGSGVYTRTTSAHASLPRSTAWAGTSTSGTPEPACGRATTVPGKYYVFSVSVRAISTLTGALHMDWKTSGDTYLSTTSASGSDAGTVNMSAGSTQRFAMIGLAPPTGERLVPVCAAWTGQCQITAVMVRQFDTLSDAQAGMAVDLVASNYFDGDTAGASWTGTTGLSTSTINRDPGSQATSTTALAATATAQVTSYGTASVAFARLNIATGLIAQVYYDRIRGRIRLTANGMAPNVVRAEIDSRTLGSTKWSPIRGGKVAVVGGRFQRSVDDYEFPAGNGVQYRIRAITTAENIVPVAVAQTVIVTMPDTLDEVWVKFIVAPARNTRVQLVGWSEVARKSRSAVFGVRGRPDPIVVSDVHTSRTVSVDLRTETEDEAEALDQALGAGFPCYFQTPSNVPLRSMYATVGDYSWRRVGRRDSTHQVFTVPLTEVAPPPLSVVGPGLTFQSLRDTYDTFADLVDDADTFLEVAG